VGATPRARDLPDGELAANGQPNWTRITDASITDPSLPEIVKSTTAPYLEVAFVNASEPLNCRPAGPLWTSDCVLGRGPSHPTGSLSGSSCRRHPAAAVLRADDVFRTYPVLARRGCRKPDRSRFRSSARRSSTARRSPVPRGSKATMTLDRYAHALPERDREAASMLGALTVS
jgi:hypothetical protein